MIFKTKADLTKHIAINQNFELIEITPSYNQAVNEYILPALSRAFYKEIDTWAGAANATDDQKEAVELLRAALAPYTHFLYSFVGSVQIGAQGIQESSSANNQPARQWTMYDFRKSLIRTGDTALDALLEFLESKKDVFETWKNSDAYTLTVDLFFSQSGQMKEFSNISGGRRTYLAMRPYIRRAERQYIKNILGEALFNQLKGQLKAGNLTEANSLLVKEYIRPALAPLTLMTAIPELSLEMTDEGLKFKSFDNGITKMHMPATEDKSKLLRSLSIDGNSELKVLEGFLIKNVEDYEAFKTSQSWIDYAAITANPQLDYPDYDAKIVAV